MSHDLEQRISNFLSRKGIDPELSSVSGRQEGRTRKYAAELLQSGQLLMTR